MRCAHEAQTSGGGSFLTLTYRDDALPLSDHNEPTLHYPDFQKFLKRLRKSVGPVRYLMCGEYGSHTHRPHYHCILFGHVFADARPHRVLPAYTLYRSPLLERLWPHGYSLIGNLTPHSIGYVCRYNLKKVVGPSAADHYNGRVPEMIHMSLKPGIGSDWLSSFSGDIYKVDALTDHVHRDAVRWQSRDCKPPRYYDKLLARSDGWVYQCIMAAREEYAKAQPLPSVDDLRNGEAHAQYVSRMALHDKQLRDIRQSTPRL